jgi:hypothetical protein
VDPEPAFKVTTDAVPDPNWIRIQGFDDQKLKKKKNTDEKFF